MKQLTLLIYLRNDTANTLEKRIEYMRKSENFFPSLEGRDGVTLLSDNAILFDETKSHDVFVQLCSALHGPTHGQGKFPYLVIRLESTDGWLASGVLPTEVSTALKSLNVPCVP
jgi:hypothetical protein